MDLRKLLQVLNKPFGLRAEIIINLSILMCAALLSIGLILLRWSEREMINERVAAVREVLTVLTRNQALVTPGTMFPDRLRREVERLSYKYQSLIITDRDLDPLLASGSETVNPAALRQSKYTQGPLVSIEYNGVPLSFVQSDQSFLVTLPLYTAAGTFVGSLQARYPLQDIPGKLLQAQKVLLVYVVITGTVLVLIGFVLLSRSLVGPIRKLKVATGQIASGDLEQELPEEGANDIAELAASFNEMTRALKKSREETNASILSLMRTNAELNQTREELIRSEKMASVGHLAAGMAHEIGNPLAASVGYIEFLKAQLREESSLDIADRALTEMNRIDGLVRELLDYARPDRGVVETIDPVAVLQEAVSLLRHQGALSKLPLKDDLPEALPWTEMDPSKLLQVFINLLINAKDASKDGGAIILTGGEDNNHIWLSVADEGEGMEQSTIGKIFDPFYTTKDPGKGRGLGLSVCHRIIEEAGGHIEVHSAPGLGSVFTVRLQKAPESKRNSHMEGNDGNEQKSHSDY